MRVQYEAWEEAMRILVQVRSDPNASQADNAAAVQRAGDTMAALLRRMVARVDAQDRKIDRQADQTSAAIDSGDEDIHRLVNDLMSRMYTFDERLRALEVGR
jgi:peptidoglycan hydrolase CwlO-like protein